MFSKYFTSAFTALLVTTALVTPHSAIAQTTIDEDKLDTVNGMRWGGNGLPFDKVVEIKDALVNSPLGKVVIDRHGEDPQGVLFKEPFAAPSPGRFVVVSLWGSKIEGCFVKMIVQTAPSDGRAELEEIAPKMLELGVGEQILQLKRSTNAKVRGFQGNYTYTTYENRRSIENSSTWFMTDTLFDISPEAANLLRNAPAKEIKARLTFENGDTKLIPIGSSNVKRWQEAFGFNSSCSAPQ
ncbi:hypothetical protein [Nostoc sp. CMAA1605]|uniref:hypothetical protein n=1 Tax=Nostoc sp. CMAA1605 TaxID=2055159 RepID=UPI001F22F157|nr:hypothetical protein [Nostoc sp. CMAA1605]MCF4969990.1 hypothetical protein [Nostoc sp. CMAA1605]